MLGKGTVNNLIFFYFLHFKEVSLEYILFCYQLNFLLLFVLCSHFVFADKVNNVLHDQQATVAMFFGSKVQLGAILPRIIRFLHYFHNSVYDIITYDFEMQLDYIAMQIYTDFSVKSMQSAVLCKQIDIFSPMSVLFISTAFLCYQRA